MDDFNIHKPPKDNSDVKFSLETKKYYYDFNKNKWKRKYINWDIMDIFLTFLIAVSLFSNTTIFSFILGTAFAIYGFFEIYLIIRNNRIKEIIKSNDFDAEYIVEDKNE